MLRNLLMKSDVSLKSEFVLIAALFKKLSLILRILKNGELDTLQMGRVSGKWSAV